MLPVSQEYADKLDAMMRSDLDWWASCWFWILVASTAIVVLGLLAELPEVWAEVIRPVHRWVKNEWIPRAKNIDLGGWEKVCPELPIVVQTELSHRQKLVVGAFALIGWIFVAFGVAGEGIGEYFVNDAETNLRAFDQAVLVDTQHSANSASLSASLANTFVGKVQEKTDAVKREADSAEKEVTSVSQQAGDVDDKLELALSMLSVRKVRNPEKMRAVLNEYGQHGPWPLPVVVKSYLGDLEGFWACLSIGETLSEAIPKGPQTLLACGREPFPPGELSVDGIELHTFSPPLDATIVEIVRLRDILRGDGGLGTSADIEVLVDSGYDKQHVDIFVGIDPRFSLERMKWEEERIKKQHKSK